MGKRWVLNQVDEILRDQLVKELKVSELLVTLLIKRGMKDKECAKKFLFPKEEDMSDPFLISDMDRAVERIGESISKGERILVYGHDDVDGITSLVVVTEVLRNLNGEVVYLAPNSRRVGFGPSKETIKRAREEGVKLIITVDCGLSCLEEVAYAKELGVDTIIVDHHELPFQLPPALAVINPKCGELPQEIRQLAGVGVAYKLAQATAIKNLGLTGSQWFSCQKGLWELVALGTIADRVPLIGDNRIFTKIGLERMRGSDRPGIRAIIEAVGGINWEKLSENLVQTQFVPLLSSSESINGSNNGCELLLTDSPLEAVQIATLLFEKSKDWQERVKVGYERASRSAKRLDLEKTKIIIVVDNEMELSFLGPCASKLREEFFRPAIVIGFKKDCALGEARGPAGFDLVDCFRFCQDLLIQYGGHKQAAGFTIQKEKIDDFIKRANLYAESKLSPDELIPVFKIDAELPLRDLTSQVFRELESLPPFGSGNPEPLFLARGEKLGKGSFHWLGREEDLVVKLPEGADYFFSLESEFDLVYTVKGKEVKVLDFKSGE